MIQVVDFQFIRVFVWIEDDDFVIFEWPEIKMFIFVLKIFK